MRPPGPVCGVTRFIPRIFEASSAASSAERASFTPPPLPRPPAWICAFTTTTGVASFWATLRASSGLVTISPRGVGTPKRRIISLA